MKVVILTVIAWICYLVAAQEKVCSSVCSTVGMLQSTPGRSCDDIYQINKASRVRSGNYWINTTTGAQQVYCDMELKCGGHKGGWMRIADLDISRGDDCPTGWTNITTPVTACIAPSDDAGCYSTNFPTLSIPYSKVCGMAVGYQKGYPDAFYTGFTSINSVYVDGLSITYGIPRKHIWTYAIGGSDKGSEYPLSHCPCSQISGASNPSSFVHDNYYCESGNVQGTNQLHFYTDDPVWDGQGCSDENNCCSDASLPWFYRQFPLTTIEDMEARLCFNQRTSDENILISNLQLYVQ